MGVKSEAGSSSSRSSGSSTGSATSSTGAGTSTEIGERVVSALFGLSLIAASIRDSFGADAVPLARLAGLLGLCVGVLLLVRRPPREAGSRKQIAAALPSLVVGSVVLQLLVGSRPAGWMLSISALGACLALVSILTLGRSFAVLPSRRELVDRGPYRLIRHPAYLGQWLVVLGCSPAADPPWLGIALALGLLPWLALRLRAEEQLLSNDPAFAAYFTRVKWRLFPGLW